MKRFFAVVCVAVGLAACGPVSPEESEGDALASTEQELCPAECPAGTRFVQYTWVCTGQTTSTCRSGIEREYALCYDSYNSTYVMGTTTCRQRCGCLVAD
jgi:hypothetical protein